MLSSSNKVVDVVATAGDGQRKVCNGVTNKNRIKSKKYKTKEVDTSLQILSFSDIVSDDGKENELKSNQKLADKTVPRNIRESSVGFTNMNATNTTITTNMTTPNKTSKTITLLPAKSYKTPTYKQSHNSHNKIEASSEMGKRLAPAPLPPTNAWDTNQLILSIEKDSVDKIDDTAFSSPTQTLKDLSVSTYNKNDDYDKESHPDTGQNELQFYHPFTTANLPGTPFPNSAFGHASFVPYQYMPLQSPFMHHPQMAPTGILQPSPGFESRPNSEGVKNESNGNGLPGRTQLALPYGFYPPNFNAPVYQPMPDSPIITNGQWASPVPIHWTPLQWSTPGSPNQWIASPQFGPPLSHQLYQYPSINPIISPISSPSSESSAQYHSSIANSSATSPHINAYESRRLISKKTDQVHVIKIQLIYYFSTENLCKDLYLRSLIDADDGTIQLSNLMKFQRLQTLTNGGKDIKLVLQALTHPELSHVEVLDGELLRLKSWKEWVIRKGV